MVFSSANVSCSNLLLTLLEVGAQFARESESVSNDGMCSDILMRRTARGESMPKTLLFGAAVAATAMSIALVGNAGAQSQAAPGSSGQQPDAIKVTGCLQQRGSMPSTGGVVGTSGVAAAGTSTGTPATSTSGFVLMNARAGMAGGGAAVPDAATGTSAAGSVAGTPTSAPITGGGSLTGSAVAPPSPGGTASLGNPGDGMYYLDGQNGELRDHVGHQVEITGVLAAAAGSGGQGAATDRAAAGSSAAAATGQTTTPDANASGLLSRGATGAANPAPGTNAGPISAGPLNGTIAGARIAVQSVKMIAPNCSSR
jgi:hypothetical protein